MTFYENRFKKLMVQYLVQETVRVSNNQLLMQEGHKEQINFY
jgi:hypothetical protein